jgi:hypothetical protein
VRPEFKVFAKESRIELDRGLPAKTKLTIVLGE